MVNSDDGDDKSKKPDSEEPVEYPVHDPPVDVENPSTTPGVSSIIRRWQREDLLKKGSLVLRASALVFSLISLIVMGSNKHGDWRNFDNYEEYRYCLAIAILAFLYTGVQVSREIYQILTRKDIISARLSAYVGFAGDQIVAYLLISAMSAAAPITNRMREGSDNLFTDASAASIGMAFFAFIALAVSALVSGFKVSRQTYI